jgi:F-type H+-transporting ATPase subunit c
MRKFVAITLLALAALMMSATFVLAQEEGGMAAASDAKLSYYAMAVLGCGLAIGIAALGTGIGMGVGLSKACDGVARNPGASGKIMTTLIVGLALIESLCIYALVVVLIVLFVNPFGV